MNKNEEFTHHSADQETKNAVLGFLYVWYVVNLHASGDQYHDTMNLTYERAMIRQGWKNRTLRLLEYSDDQTLSTRWSLISKKHEERVTGDGADDGFDAINWEKALNDLRITRDVCLQSGRSGDLSKTLLTRLNTIEGCIQDILTSYDSDRQQALQVVTWTLNDLWKEKETEKTDGKLVQYFIDTLNDSVRS